MNEMPVFEFLSTLMENMKPEDILAIGVTAEFTSQIDDIRVGMGMNEKEFAEHTGITPALADRLENCECDLTIAEMAEIACKLDKNLVIRLEDLDTGNDSAKCPEGADK